MQMRHSVALAAGAAALILAMGEVSANPVGVPPNAKLIAVADGQNFSIELGIPPAHGWFVMIWGSYNIGDKEFFANGSAQEGQFDPKTGCVYLASADGKGQCFSPSESQMNHAHEYLKSVHSPVAMTLGFEPPAGATGAFYYRVDNAP